MQSIQFGACAAMVLAAVGAAQAGVTFTTQSSFVSALQPGFYAENFQSFADSSGHATPMSFSGGGYSYSASTSAQAFLMFSLGGNRYFTTSGQPTTQWSAPITLTFTGLPVNAIGGSVFTTTAFGNIAGSDVLATFSDGSSHTISGGSNSTFFGYVSEVAISTLTFSPPATHHFISIDNLHVGWSNVPAPGAAAMFSIAGGIATRRRRRA